MSVSRRGLFGWLVAAPVAMVTPAVAAKPALTVNPLHNFRAAQRMANYWRATETEIIRLIPHPPFVRDGRTIRMTGKGTFEVIH